MMADRDVGGSGSARRGRERRLRSWWRHEQRSVAAALAAVLLGIVLRDMLGIMAGRDQRDSYVATVWRTWCMWFRLQKTVDFQQLQFIKVGRQEHQLHNLP